MFALFLPNAYFPYANLIKTLEYHLLEASPVVANDFNLSPLVSHMATCVTISVVFLLLQSGHVCILIFFPCKDFTTSGMVNDSSVDLLALEKNCVTSISTENDTPQRLFKLFVRFEHHLELQFRIVLQFWFEKSQIQIVIDPNPILLTRNLLDWDRSSGHFVIERDVVLIKDIEHDIEVLFIVQHFKGETLVENRSQSSDNEQSLGFEYVDVESYCESREDWAALFGVCNIEDFKVGLGVCVSETERSSRLSEEDVGMPKTLARSSISSSKSSCAKASANSSDSSPLPVSS
ncbi:hypothetical protein WICPIJ_008974 [Wickerhamomyces pijperi]|uniref:Uncharacterized protein n=1 Tax=Wickerhamomyces pijperi TaxID=599730 RepID=A0A9P8PSL0_WICPI|nr:hypothetical protein WICPIJ_008974 [Wickerhamomyces pijperi]